MSSACCAACGASCAAAAASCAACGAAVAAVTAAAAASHREGQATAPESPKRQATLLLVAFVFVALGVAVVAWAFLTQR